MTQDLPLDLVMFKLRGGDSTAAQLIFQRFVHRLTALASQQFDHRLRAKADPEDVVQSVYRSFFRRDVRAPYQLTDWDSLWALLASITINKCLDRRTYWNAARRDVGREQVAMVGDDEAGWWQAMDRGPTPLQASLLAEILESVLISLPAKHRSIAEMCLQGYTAAETAERCDSSERTVARVVAKIKERLRELDVVAS